MSLPRNIGSRPRAGLPDPRVNAFAIKVSLLCSLGIFAGLHMDWDSEFWPLFFSPLYLLVTYLIGRFIAAERYAKQDNRTALASQASEDARLARDAARQADASARDAEMVAHDAQRIAQERAVAADASRKAVAGAINARAAARRAGSLAECANDDAGVARNATRVEQAASAAQQAAADRREAVVAAEEAATHAMATRQALEDARSAIAREGASHECTAPRCTREIVPGTGGDVEVRAGGSRRVEGGRGPSRARSRGGSVECAGGAVRDARGPGRSVPTALAPPRLRARIPVPVPACI